MNKIIIFNFLIFSLLHPQPTEVTFIVDMSQQAVQAGDGDYPAVYVSGGNINGPAGLEMNDNGDGIWSLTTQLNPGSYTYKFRNGYYNYWDGPGWESDQNLIAGGCAYGQYNDRIFTLIANQPMTVGPFCFGSCESNCVNDSIEYTLVWSDEFDSSDIDMSKWSYDVGTGDWGWGNGEAQYYTSNSNNSFIEDGKLIIQALLQNYGGANYTSARMVTKNKGDWRYGRIEVRAKLPAGTGTWPAIWMLPTDYVYGGWPNSGEIDIMEHVGFDPGRIHGTAHTDLYNWFDGSPPPGGSMIVSDFNSEFHDYILEWTENNLKWFVDGNQYFTYTNNNQGWSRWPFDQYFHLLLNIAIGGTWGGEQGIDDSIFPVRLEVDYVRVFEASSQLSSQIERNNVPLRLALGDAYPNPFNHNVIFPITLGTPGIINYTIFDIQGRVITSGMNRFSEGGKKIIYWDGTNRDGELVSAGTYFFRAANTDISKINKIVYLK